MIPEFKIYYPILFDIFLTFATSEPKQQNLISARIESPDSLTYTVVQPALNGPNQQIKLQLTS